AERGRGSRLRYAGVDSPIAVTDSSNTIWLDGKSEQAASVLNTVVLMKRWYVWKFSSSLAYAYVARGQMAAVMQFSSRSSATAYGSVHAAAGCFIAREAGAIVTDVKDGTPWTLSTPSFLMAATPQLHQQLFDIIRAAK